MGCLVMSVAGAGGAGYVLCGVPKDLRDTLRKISLICMFVVSFRLVLLCLSSCRLVLVKVLVVVKMC